MEDASAGPGDDDSEPEMEIDSSDDDMELPDSATAQNWIDLIKKAAPGLGVPCRDLPRTKFLVERGITEEPPTN